MSTSVVRSAEVTERRSWFASGPAWVWYIAGAVTLLQLLTANRYGYFGDEFYHMACGEHLSWGYVDQPPLIAVFAWLTRHLFGTSLFSIRILPALAGLLAVWLTGLIARELGGGRFAQGFAALCSACAGVYLILNHLFTMNVFEPLFWMGCAYVVIRIVKTGNQKLWLWFGALAGIGLENKYSMAIFGFGVVIGLVLTKERKAFAGRWIWIAGLLAFFIFLPNLIWNVQHHFPFLELMRNIRANGRDLPFTPLGYIRAQALMMTPVTFPVWLLGALYFFFFRSGTRFRVLGWAFISVLVTLIVLHGKDYYAAPVYPMMFAGGAIAIEQISAGRWLGWLKPLSITLVLLVTLAFLPLFVPVLSPESFLRYQAKLPFKIQPDEKSMLEEPMPHYYSGCFGWHDLVRTVAEAYARVPAQDRADTAIYAGDFATAGAIDLLGPKLGLPKAIGGHQSYWLWGPRNYTGATMIVIGGSADEARKWFEDVTVVAQLHNPYAGTAYGWGNKTVLLCRGKKFPSLSQAWPRLKHWD
ncbi:MAG TPA: glycosyltransferase family 39 protein [Verrucomicrobiae bacterium]|nr:glycosyltransferase family 39 protein [Verrucomicrobiae bacterium]